MFFCCSLLTWPTLPSAMLMPWDRPSRRPMSSGGRFRASTVRLMPLRARWAQTSFMSSGSCLKTTCVIVHLKHCIGTHIGMLGFQTACMWCIQWHHAKSYDMHIFCVVIEQWFTLPLLYALHCNNFLQHITKILMNHDFNENLSFFYLAWK